MAQSESFYNNNDIIKKNEENSYLPINLLFGIFPISFIIGSLIVNINLLLFCLVGIYHLKSKILETKFNLPIKIIFLFFIAMLFSTSLSFLKSFYYDGYSEADFIRLVKSLLYFRFLLFLIITYILIKYNILNLKYFFIVAAIASLLISLDIIYQYIFGVNIIGFKSNGYNNAGFFGDEYIAGGYILRFSFFLIFFSILTFKNKKYASLISTIIVISILATGILLSGNRMPFVLFSFGLLLILLFNSKIKTILLLSFIPIIMIFKLIISTDDNYRQQYETYYHNAKNIVNFIPEFQTYLKPEEVKHSANLDKDYELVKSLAKKDSTDWKMIKWEASHRRIFLAALDTWKLHKIFGNGIKSFRITCPKLGGDEINLAEDLRADKKNRLCSTHPHNYYLEILTDTGIVGFIFVFLLALLFIIFIFKNMKFRYEINIKNLVLLSAIISLALELTPLRSSGSIFTSNNATYLAIIGSLVLGYKELLKTNIE